MRAAKGDGSLFETPTGWRGYVTVNGRRRYFSGATKALAAQKKRELLGKRDAGTLSTGRSQSLGAWLTHWLDITKPTHRAKTDEDYRYMVDHYLSAAFKKVPLAKLTVERIESEYTRLTEQGLSGSTRRQVHSILHTALKLAQQRGHITVNPASLVVDKPSPARRSVTAISDADVAAIEAVLEGQRLKARWHLGLALGIRPAEALGLEWSHLDDGWLRVEQQIQKVDGKLILVPLTKTEAGRRRIPIPAYIRTHLDDWRQKQLMEQSDPNWVPWSPDAQPHAWMFTSARRPGRPVTHDGDASVWRKILAKAGVPHAARYSARHTAASVLLAHGVDPATVAAILGHADPGFTLRTYSHTVDERLQQAAATLDKVQNRVQSAEETMASSGTNPV